MVETCMQCGEEVECIHLNCGCYCHPCLDRRMTVAKWVVDEARVVANRPPRLNQVLKVWDELTL